jgi:uncharacterized membrane protein
MDHDAHQERTFPVAAGLLFGLGLGGFCDGMLLHQVLQWHHMLTSAGYPLDSVPHLQVNTLWDGVFHLSTYLFVLLGLLTAVAGGASEARALVRQAAGRDPVDGLRPVSCGRRRYWPSPAGPAPRQ